MERVQKIIANYGYCSRRKAEKLIEEGKVEVNGRRVSLGDKAEWNDKIVVEGRTLKRPKRMYFAVNKPIGYESTLKGKKTVVSLVRTKERLITAGRLDKDSKGLIIVTNDGEFANRVMHPRYPVEKVYRVKIMGEVKSSEIEMLAKGVMLEDGKTMPCKVRLIKRSSKTTIISMILHEGRNRQIRRMIEKIGYRVLELVRTRVGIVTLKGIKEGSYRKLTKKEINYFRRW